VRDIESVGGKYNFTDGCGEISPDLAKEIADFLDLEEVPSAFQVFVCKRFFQRCLM
jgi:hypothetical protein